MWSVDVITVVAVVVVLSGVVVVLCSVVIVVIRQGLIRECVGFSVVNSSAFLIVERVTLPLMFR